MNELVIVKEKKYTIGVSVSLAPGKFKRTKVVLFSSRYVVMNTSTTTLYVRQHQSTMVRPVEAGKQLCFYWPEVQLAQTLNITTDLNLYDWSSPLTLTSLGDVYVKLRNKKTKDAFFILQAKIVQEQGSIMVVVSVPEMPPYKIVNETTFNLLVTQTKLTNWSSIKKGESVNYAFDDVTGVQKLDIRIGDTPVLGVDINTVQLQAESLCSEHDVYFTVTADGPTRIVTLMHSATIKRSFSDAPLMQIAAAIKAVGISIVNNHPMEIAYIYVDHLRCDYIQSTEHICLELEVMKLQLDNQKRDAPFPVILSCVDRENRFLHISIIKSAKAEKIMLFPYFSVNMQEARFAVDYAFLLSVADFIEQLLKSSENEEQKAAEDMLKQMDHPVVTISEKEQKFYFNKLELHPIKVGLSFRYNKDPTYEVGNNPMLMFLDTIGFTMVNVDDAPVKFNALILEHPFLSRDDLFDRIKLHYIRAATAELYKIIGSLDIIGNPVGLFNDLSVGVKDFFYEPATAITKSPQEFASGVLKGTTSLVSRSVHGTFHAASKLSESMAKGIRTLTFDTEYIKEGEKLSSSKALDVKQGMQMGAEALVKGIQQSASGVFVKPIEKMSKEGALAGAKQLAMGIISAPSKNLAGIISFAQKTTEGISNTQVEHIDRVRYPRVFRDDGCLLPYSVHDAFGYQVFMQLNNGKACEEEKLLMYSACGKSFTKIVILTNRAVYCVKVKLATPEWRVDMSDLENITYDAETKFVTLYWRSNQSSISKLFAGNQLSQTKVFIQDKASAEALLKRTKIAIASKSKQ